LRAAPLLFKAGRNRVAQQPANQKRMDAVFKEKLALLQKRCYSACT
jgi:hypothetical protein